MSEPAEERKFVVPATEGYVYLDAGHGIEMYVSPRWRELSERETHVRKVSCALKIPEKWALEEAAGTMATQIVEKSILIPIPDSTGDIRQNFQLAERIARVIRVLVRPWLERNIMSSSSRTRRLMDRPGLRAHEHHLKRRISNRDQRVLKQFETQYGSKIVFVDNVMVTGATFEAARRAFGKGSGLAYAQVSPDVVRALDL